MNQLFKKELSKICGRQTLKNLSRPYHFVFFKACVSQILFGPFLNPLSHLFRLAV